MDRPGRSLTLILCGLALAASACQASPPPTAEPAPATTVAVESGAPAEPPATTPVPLIAAPEQPDTGVVTAPSGGLPLSMAPGAVPFLTAYEGLHFPVMRTYGRWMEVLTPCDTSAWVPVEAATFEPTSHREPAGPDFDLTTAVVVIDAGHGGQNVGAVGPTGFVENEANLAIARRVVDLLSSPREVHWETGLVTAGTAYPAVGRVLLTRPEGPPGADFEAGLLYRAMLANLAGADAFVSIHNNAAPEGPIPTPGSEVFYSVMDPESRRLAGILYEELIRSFSRLEARWVGNSDRGARYRLSPSGFIDYYGLLRRAEVPTVLAEGMFISNPDEEALLRSDDGQRAYAEAVYRAIVRFLTTDDEGSGWSDPIPSNAPVAGRGDARPNCLVPPEPGTELR